MQLVINESLVRSLINTQFPQFAHLPVRQVLPGGWDNRTFRLGDQLLVRMPSAERYTPQIKKEHQWLPILAPLLPLPIPIPVVIGEPSSDYPWHWSIYRWLEGEAVATAPVDDACALATSLAQFLLALQRIAPQHGPVAGAPGFRGEALTNYDAETRQAIAVLKDKIDVEAVTAVWEAALATNWDHSPVWIHGDISAGNLLMKEGRLSAVIDFGAMAIGDPACDLAMAWTFFSGESRTILRKMLPYEAGTWARGRGWVLWKALIVAAGIVGNNAVEGEKTWHIIEEVLADHAKYQQ